MSRTTQTRDVSMTGELIRDTLTKYEVATSSPARVQLGQELAELVAALLAEAVADARADGHSWNDIAPWVKLSKPGVHRRYGASSTSGRARPAS